jgi:hypothetical protein
MDLNPLMIRYAALMVADALFVLAPQLDLIIP